MFTVLEIAPERNGWAAAIIRTCACQAIERVPLRGWNAQSNTVRCSSARSALLRSCPRGRCRPGSTRSAAGRSPAFAERQRHRLVDDLQHAAAGQLLVLHQGDVGLDARRVAIHQEADRAGGRQHRGLGVAEAVAAAARRAPRPRRRGPPAADTRDRPDRSRRPRRGASASRATSARGFRHSASNGPTAAASSVLARLAEPCSKRRHRAAQPAGGRRVVGQAAGHDQAAQVRVAQPQRAEAMAVLGDPLGRIAGMIDQDFLGDEEDAAGGLEAARRRTCRRRRGTSSG